MSIPRAYFRPHSFATALKFTSDLPPLWIITGVIALVLAYLVIVSYQYNAGGAVLETILTDASGRALISPHTATIIAAIFIAYLFFH